MSQGLARPYAVPQAGGSGRAIALAVLMHVLLGGLLFFGIRWQSSAPAVVQAELWSATPQTAAPAARPVPPQPKVEPPTPQPKVDPPTPQPKVSTPPPAPEPPPRIKADIVEKASPKIEPKQPKEPVKIEPKPLPKPVPKVEARPEPKPVPKAAPPKPEPKVRPDLARLMQQATAESQPRVPSELSSLLSAAGKESNGKDAQTSGPRGDQNGYTAKLVAAIRSQSRYAATATGNPSVAVRIEQLPNGEVLNVTVTKASGVQAFDDAVERAVRAASPLPRPAQGTPPRELNLTYFMYDKS